MHKPTAIGVCLVVCLAVFSVGAASAGTVKIGILDFQKVLETSKAGKAAQEKIKNAAEQMQEELKKRKDEIEESRKNLERESLVMNKQAREDKEREIRIKINDFKTLQQKYYKEYKTQEQKLIHQIQKEVFDLAGKLGKEQGYTLILEKRDSAAIYHDASIDITEELIRRYDKEQGESAAKSE